MPLDRIIIATGNPHKVEELRAMLALPGVEFLGLRDLPGHETFHEPDETGDTFFANATIKALSYAEQTGLPCLADDSGLEVDALGGAPGVISSHYSTDGRETGLSRPERDAANNARLLRELEVVPPEKRSARFACQMVLASPSRPGPSGTGFQPVFSYPRPADMSEINRHLKGPVRRTQGDLPHWHEDGATYFVTFRVLRGELTSEERDLVLASCLYWHTRRVVIHLVVAMPDHVHMLLSPLLSDTGWHDLPELIHSIKSYTANQINRSRGEAGPLWQPEYFDRIVRDAEEFKQKWDYMLRNPVKAGLVGHWAEYRWTRAGDEETDAHRLEAGATVLCTSGGTFEGRIGLPGDVPRGDNGFGYDPLFLVAPGFDRTSAELPPEEKNRLSHRGAAAVEMLAELRALRAASK